MVVGSPGKKFTSLILQQTKDTRNLIKELNTKVETYNANIMSNMMSILTNASEITDLRTKDHTFESLGSMPSDAEIQNFEIGRVFRIGFEWFIVTGRPTAHGATIRVGLFHLNARNEDYAGYAANTGIHPPHGRLVSNPGGILDVLTQWRVSGASHYDYETVVKRTAYRTAKGSNEQSGDVLNVRYTDTGMSPTTVDTALDYAPGDNYNRNGIDFLSFKKRFNVSSPLPLVSLGGQNLHVDCFSGSTSLWPDGMTKSLTPLTSEQAIVNQGIIFNQQVEIAALVTRVTALESG